MIIQDIAASLPTRQVTNEEVVDLIKFHSKNTYEGDLNKAGRVIKILLDKSGLVTRYWCNAQESPIEHVEKAARQVLYESKMSPGDVELLIYVGIGRGFLEPGNSYMVAKALGFRNAQCFDVIDACMSWTRAMSIVDSLFKSGQYGNALIVNAEFNMIEGGPLYPGNFALKNREQFEHILPSFTIGEAATATMLFPSKTDNFQFNFHAKPILADLCTIPINGYEGFCHPTDELCKNGVMQFTSFGHELHEYLDQELPVALKKLPIAKNDIDIVFTHASSKAAWHKYAEKAELADKVYHIYQDTGNLVSASIPAAIALAKKEGKLKRGDTVLCWVGSAGMSFNITNFLF